MDQQKIVNNIEGIVKKYERVMMLMKNNPHPYDKTVIGYTTGIVNDLETLRYIRIFLAPLRLLNSKTFGHDVDIDAISNSVSDIRALVEKIGATFGCSECVASLALTEMELISVAANLSDSVSALVTSITKLNDEISGWDEYNLQFIDHCRTMDRVIAKAILADAKTFVKNECAEPGTFPGYVANRIVDAVKHL